MKVSKLTKTYILWWERCPHAFYLMQQKVANLENQVHTGKAIRSNEMAAVGNAVHSVLKEFITGDEKKARKGLIALLIQPKYVDEADEMLCWVKDWCHLLEPLAVEYQEPVEVPGLPLCQVGFDILHYTPEKVKLIEVKTSWKLPAQTDLENGIEARWYKLMLDVMYPKILDKEITYLYPRTQTFINVHPEPLKVSYLQDLVSLMNTGPYVPNYSSCQYCLLVLSCSCRETGFESASFAKNYLKHKAMADSYLSQLKQMVKDKELKVGNHVFYWATVSRRKILNPRAFWGLIKEAGVYINPDMDDLQKKASHLIADAIAQDIISVSHYSQFMVDDLSKFY